MVAEQQQQHSAVVVVAVVELLIQHLAGEVVGAHGQLQQLQAQFLF